MVFVKVRETYDLHTTQNKMTVIGIHTPKPDIIKMNYPGLLMQCKMYRPVSCDVRLACASVLPVDPLGVGTEPGDVAPEDMFNPILYKAISNKGMSQLEARLSMLNNNSDANFDVTGNSAVVEVDTFTAAADEFNTYYGLLANTHEWRHANPQAGLEMTGLKPLVYEMVYNVGDNLGQLQKNSTYTTAYPGSDGYKLEATAHAILGDSKPMPFINCTSYSLTSAKISNWSPAGFPNLPGNCEIDVPYLNVLCGAIIVPPSRLHSLYFRMVVEWTIEFSSIRPLSEITSFDGIATVGAAQHFQNYSYEETKRALTGDESSILEKDACMVSSNVDITKVM